MADLEFRVGGLSEEFYLGRGCSFVVEHEEGVVSIYVSRGAHDDVKDTFLLSRNKIVGGGSCCWARDYVIIDNISTTYWGIPKKAAKIFAELIAEELRKKGKDIKGGKEDVLGYGNNDFWWQFGDKFDS